MAKGTLEQELAEAVDQTLQAMQEDEEDGMLPDEAWEANQERYLLLPEEWPEGLTLVYDAMVEKNRLLRELDEED